MCQQRTNTSFNSENFRIMNTTCETLPTNSSHSTTTIGVQQTSSSLKSELGERYRHVRHFSEKLCETLEPEDYVIQTMPEASPTKWHLAHTSWFFETFISKKFFPGYQSMHPDFGFLFNSYYNAVGPFYSR